MLLVLLLRMEVGEEEDEGIQLVLEITADYCFCAVCAVQRTVAAAFRAVKTVTVAYVSAELQSCLPPFI